MRDTGCILSQQSRPVPDVSNFVRKSALLSSYYALCFLGILVWPYAASGSLRGFVWRTQAFISSQKVTMLPPLPRQEIPLSTAVYSLVNSASPASLCVMLCSLFDCAASFLCIADAAARCWQRRWLLVLAVAACWHTRPGPWPGPMQAVSPPRDKPMLAESSGCSVTC